LYETDKKSVNYLYNNIHGIPYSSGNIEYDQLKNILETNLNHFDVIFVKEHAKSEFLLQYLPVCIRIINLEDSTEQVPKLGPTRNNCDNHVFKSCNCSVQNVYTLFDYVFNKLTN